MTRGRHWPPLSERFEESYIPEPNSGCWLWAGATCGQNYAKGGGYGTIFGKGRQLKAHHLSWETRNGPIPAGLHVLHKCDVSICVNPDHLFLGTNYDNVLDKMAKGRHKSAPQRGTENGNSKLTEEMVRYIRTSSLTGIALARKLSVSDSTISRVRNGVLWTHV